MPDEAFSLAKYIGGSALVLFAILIGKRIIEKVVKKVVDWPGSVEKRLEAGDKRFAAIQQDLAVQHEKLDGYGSMLSQINTNVAAILKQNGKTTQP